MCANTLRVFSRSAPLISERSGLALLFLASLSRRLDGRRNLAPERHRAMNWKMKNIVLVKCSGLISLYWNAQNEDNFTIG